MNDSSLSSAIAIVGMGGRFPGADDTDAFWQNVRAGVCSITDFTHDELLADGVDPADLANPNYVSSKGVLSEADRFEAELFGFSPKDATVLDPQHRMLLEMAWAALEDAGYNPRAVPETTGVYVGGGISEHAVAAMADSRLVGELGLTQVRLLTDKDFLASWISYRLGLRGPSMAVQTACSTSLTAVHLAVQSLLLGECSLALAGGVSVDAVARRGYLYQEGGISSSDGRCRPFDEESGGTLPGNGVGIVVLRRYEDAVRDGDTIYALIRGSAVTNDGVAKISMTAPGIEGQSGAIAEALATAELTPDQIQYIEMHGTGTALGDQIEVEAATAAFGVGPDEPSWCGIGSVKSNIGHLDAAAGVTGLIKATLMLKHQELVPNANFTRPNPLLQLEKTPFRVVDRLAHWPRPAGSRRRAGVTSVGMGGTNVHVVLEEAPDRADQPAPVAGPQLLPLSARTERSLAAGAEALGRYLQGPDAAALGDIAHTLQRGRLEQGVRGFVVAGLATDASTGFLALAESRAFRSAGSPDGPVILYPGELDPSRGTGEELYRTFPVFRDAFDGCARYLAERHGLDARLRDFGSDTPGGSAQEDVRTWHARLFSAEYAAADLWAKWGVRPGATVGHGLGEYVSAVLAGVFTRDEALNLVVARAELISRSKAGRMLAVPLPEAEAVPLLNNEIALAAVNNGARTCVLSGSAAALEDLAGMLRQAGTAHQWVDTDHDMHTPLMDGLLDAFEAVVADAGPRRPAVPYISTVSGGLVDGGKVATARYWRDQLRATVRFDEAFNAAREMTKGPVLEFGRGDLTHSQSGGGLAADSVHAVLGGSTEAVDALAALGELWSNGQQIDWSVVTGSTARRAVHVPGHVFDGAPRGAFRLSGLPAARPAGDAVAVPHGRAPSTSVTETSVVPEASAVHDDVAESSGELLRKRLSELLTETLGVGIGEFGRSFLEIGGDSLGAVHLANRIQETVGIDVPLQLLVEGHSLHELVDRVARLAEERGAGGLIGDLLEEIEAGG